MIIETPPTSPTTPTGPTPTPPIYQISRELDDGLVKTNAVDKKVTLSNHTPPSEQNDLPEASIQANPATPTPLSHRTLATTTFYIEHNSTYYNI